MKENSNISAPKSGMNREAHPSQLKNTDYTFALNANTDSQVGESVNITNEPSNSLAVNFPVGYKVIHYKKDLLNNRTYYFLVNATEGTPNYKKSSIGYVDDTMIGLYNQDPYVECEDCKKNHNRLEEISQAPSHTYVEIINDNCLPIGDGFNFDINYPIKFSELKQEKGVTNIYWNDKLNKPRWMCLSDVSYLQDEEISCDGVLVPATCLKTYKLLQFPEHARLKIEPETVQTGGTLKMGVYEFYAAYSNLYGEESTNYSTPTNPISIFDENNNILNDETTDSFTNYSIRLKVSNLDTRFPFYKVVCVETNNVNRTKSAFIAGIYPTTDDTILYTSSGSTNDDYIVTGNSSLKRRVDLYELSKVRPEYEFAAGDTQSGGRKFMWGLKTKSEVNLQPVVNLFGALLKWQSNIAKESLFKTPIATAKYKGWMRNEVQPFALRLLFKDGGYSSNFPLIARPSVGNDKQSVSTTDKNYLSIIENSPACTTIDRDERWQIFNTAELETVLTNTNVSGGTPIIETLEKKCILDKVLTIPAGSVEVEIIEGGTYNGLEDYIQNNLEYITDPNNTDVYNKIGKYFHVDAVTNRIAAIPEECTPSFNTESCPDAPVFVREETTVDDITGSAEDGEEVNEFVYRELEDYRRSLPSKACTIYRINAEDAKPVPDTEWRDAYMGCTTIKPHGWIPLSVAVPKVVYFRDADFQNESCSYATTVVNNNVTNQSGLGFFHNYYAASPDATKVEDIEAAYKGGKKAAGEVTDEFRPYLHKGALFFSIAVLEREKLVFEITKNSISTTNDTNDNISDASTPQKLRYTFYKDCKAVAPLPILPVPISPEVPAGTPVTSIIVDTTVGSLIELDIKAILATLPPGTKLETLYVAVDTPYVKESVPSDPADCDSVKVEKYRTAPPEGCFSIYTRDKEILSVKSTWDSIVLDKTQVYASECKFIIPKVEDCAPIPYARGTFAFWKSTEMYPHNVELYDSSTLKITHTDLQELTETDRELFKEYFVNTKVNGSTYTLKDDTNFTCSSPIRHFKFPDNNISPFMADMEVTSNSDALIFPLGVYLDPAVVRAMLLVALNNNLLTPKQYDSIEGYEILKGDNSIHKSVIANGLGYDMYKYRSKGKDYHYANYPHNDLGQDILHYGEDNKTLIQHPFGGTSNNKFSFLSPDTFLTRVTIPTEAVLSGYQVGASTTTFQDVEDHPKWTILGEKARKTATKLAIAEALLELIVKTAELIALQQGGFVFSLGAVGAGIAAGAYATAQFMSYGKYRYEWLKIFDDLGTAYNFASYGVSHGFHNRFIKNIPDEEGKDSQDYLRALPLRKYMKDGRYVYRDESRADNPAESEIYVNNFQREHSIFLSTGKYEFNYLPVYSDYDNNKTSVSSSRTRLGLNGCASEESLKGTVGSPYITLKNYVPDQFGIVDSIKWLTTGYSERIDKNLNANLDPAWENSNIMILGGNICISRFTWKRKLPIFKKNIVSTADRVPFNYGDYKNIGNPVYYCNYKSDSQESVAGVPFPDIQSDFNFDACGNYKSSFYVRPPAKMYLFYYGIADFLVESEINCNFRYAQNSQKEFFYPQAGDAVDWTQEKNVPIKEPNRFFYNNSYSQQVSNTPYKVLDRGFSKEEWEKRTIQDSAVIYSEMDNSENDISDPWLTYKPLNWYEFPTKYGKLIQLKGVESESIIGRFENQLVKFNSLDKLQTTGGASIELGNAGIFAGRPVEYMTTDLGYSGTQHSDMVNTPYGNFFVDAKRGQVFQRAGDDLVIISDRTGQQPSGLKSWFREQLPFKILKKFPETDIDNKFKSIGISMGWDSREERVFLTKKDYIPSEDPCLKYSDEIGFYTDCGEDEVSCPPGYTLNTTTQLCEKTALSDSVCPPGYTYDAIAKTCTIQEEKPAECVCTADVTAAGQTICGGTNTSIALTTTSTDAITYSWTVVQDGVTGASAGTGDAIDKTYILSQQLVTSGITMGTVSYRVTPIETVTGCAGKPITVVVRVKPQPNVVANPTSQEITTGETTDIKLSGNIPNTVFSWTAVATGGTTGATSGSGNVISQRLDTAGTVTYTITPTLDGCTGLPVSVVVTVKPAAVLACGGSLVANGKAGYYEVPAGVGAELGYVTVTANTRNVPDRMQIIWDGNIVADSLFVGDSLPNSGYQNEIINVSNLNKFLWNGSSFTPNGTITVDYNASHIADSTGAAGTLRSSGSVGGQIGIVPNYPSASAKASDGNIKLRFNKTAALPAEISVIMIGTNGGTAWDIDGLECPCKIDVAANPATSNISYGDTTNIALSSTAAGATFSWTVLYDGGLTGASSGSGSVIAQTLTGIDGTTRTATYTITATAGNCVSDPIQAVVTVGTAYVPCNQGMDVVFNVDYTGSMSTSIEAVKAAITEITDVIEEESAGDYRLSLVLFDEYIATNPADYANSADYLALPVEQRFINTNTTANKKQLITAMELMSPNNKASFITQLNKINRGDFPLGNGQSTPEPGDMAVDKIVNQDFSGTFRPGAAKLIIYMTDAPMSGDDDANTALDIARADVLAENCVDKSVRMLLMKSSATNLGAVENLALQSNGAVYPSFAPAAIIQAIRDICI